MVVQSLHDLGQEERRDTDRGINGSGLRGLPETSRTLDECPGASVPGEKRDYPVVTCYEEDTGETFGIGSPE